VGEFIGYKELVERTYLKKGKYIVHFRKPKFDKDNVLVGDGKYLDCMANRLNGTCLASLANSSLGARIKLSDDTLVPAKANARIIVDRVRSIAKLVARVDISRNTEIVTKYNML